MEKVLCVWSNTWMPTSLIVNFYSANDVGCLVHIQDSMAKLSFKGVKIKSNAATLGQRLNLFDHNIRLIQ